MMDTGILTTRLHRILLFLILVLVTAGCGGSRPVDPTATAAAEVAQVTDTPRPTSTPTLTPRPTDTPTATPTPSPLTANEVFDLISPAVVYLENPVKSGSGVLLDGGYILTNAHVTFPYDTVRVVFPDGTELLDVPVAGHDLLADLALVGPVATTVEPVELVDGEDLVIGSDVYLIGYPGERDQFPTPTIGRGLVSRTREWEVAGMTYFQTDAAVAGGQSGGVLVADRGQVIGITNFAFTEARYGLIASAADIAPRLDQILAGEDASGMGQRYKAGSIQNAPTIMLEDYNDTLLFVFFAEAGDQVEFSLSGQNDGGFWVDAPDGRNMIYADDNLDANEQGHFRAEISGPYFVGVFQSEYGRHVFNFSGSHTLIQMDDPDDRHIWSSKRADQEPVDYHGGIDYVGDIDFYTLGLQAGDEVDIRVDSILINPAITIDSADYNFSEPVVDYTSGGGIFGVSPRLVFRAPHTGDFLLTVEDVNPESAGYGGYVLTITPAPAAGPTPVVIAPTPTPIAGPDGQEMRRFESDRNHFTFLYPAFFESTDYVLDQPCPTSATCFGVGRAILTINEDDIDRLGVETVSEAIDATLQVLALVDPNYQVVSRGPFTSESGQTGEMIEYTMSIPGQMELRAISCLFLVGDTYVGIVYEFVNLGDLPDELRDLVWYSCSTFELTR